MMTLKKYNELMMRKLEEMNTFPRKNGIECPTCQKEMSDRNNSVLLSCPPRKDVFCESCGHSDYAVC